MTSTALARIGPSESQAAADAAGRSARAESRYRQRSESERRLTERTVDAQRQEHWRSREERNRTEPPRQLEALLAWFQREIDLDLPDALHSRGVWFDTVTREEREAGQKPEGGSLIGSLPYSPAFAARIEGSPNAKDKVTGELLSPLRSAFAFLRKGDRDMADLIQRVAMFDFAWRAVVDRPFYRPGPVGGPRRLAFFLTESQVRRMLTLGLTELWEQVHRRTPYIAAEE